MSYQQRKREVDALEDVLAWATAEGIRMCRETRLDALDVGDESSAMQAVRTSRRMAAAYMETERHLEGFLERLRRAEMS